MSAGFSLHFTVYMYPQSALYSWSAVSSLLSLFYSYHAENLFSNKIICNPNLT